MKPSRADFRRYAIAAALTAAITLILWWFRDDLTAANISLSYVLTVVVVAISQGTGPSLLAALFSFLCFNFFPVRPYYTFLVANSRDVLDLIAFFVCAALTGHLASYARQQATAAHQRAYEQQVLHRLTSLFNSIIDQQSVYETLRMVLTSLPPVRQVDVLPKDSASLPSDRTVMYLLLTAGDEIFSVLRVGFDTPPDSSLNEFIAACAVQASMVLQRIALAERAQRSRSFEEADRLKTALLHAVSHDLRTPITIIKTSASNLLNLHHAVSERERVEMLRMIEQEADRLNRMVGNLLDISRLKAGALQINRELNSLEEVAGDVAASEFQRQKEERIALHFPEEMPLVRFDYGLILQAIANLVENAMRYEPPTGCIEISGDYDMKVTRVVIRNHGPNIPVEEREAIFEPFYYGKGGNIGLGLAIAKGIVEAHQGTLWVEDTPGGGASFIFTLPLGEPLEQTHHGLQSR